MALYCTEADLVAGGLRQAAVDELDDPEVLIERASNRIDMYLRGRYKLPLSEEGVGQVKDICVALAVYYACNALGWDPETGPDKAVVMGFEDAKVRLREIASGTCHLSIEADATPTKYEGGPKVHSIPRNCGIRSDGRIG